MRLVGGDARPRRDAVSRRACREAARRPLEGIAGGTHLVTAAEKYVAGAYLVVFVVVLAYVLIIATKLARLEREVAELTELARERRVQEPERKAVALG
ncbi:MAG: CcmD family protein [Actinobacteria bacterium]|nr:MAG: CcmD family protein [Actinomycetota bacterium]